MSHSPKDKAPYMRSLSRGGGKEKGKTEKAKEILSEDTVNKN